MEATIGIALVIVSLALMLVISRTVIANTPKALVPATPVRLRRMTIRQGRVRVPGAASSRGWSPPTT